MAIFEIFPILNKARERIKIRNRINLLMSRPLLLPKRIKVTKKVTTKNVPKQFSVITVNMNNDI